MSIVATTTVPSTDLATALAHGAASLHRTRANGTTRHIPFYANGTDLRQQATEIAEARDRGIGMAEIAKTLHMSVPTVRRMLNSLTLARAIEAGNLDGITVVVATDAPVVHEPVVTFPLVNGRIWPTLDCTCGVHEAHSSKEHFGWQRTRWTAALVAAHTA